MEEKLPEIDLAQQDIFRAFNVAQKETVKEQPIGLETSFYDFFCRTVGHEPKFISELLEQKQVARDITWDLYAKYHILGGDNPEVHMLKYAHTEDDKLEISRALDDNKEYRQSSGYAQLTELKALLLLIVILVLNKKDLRMELPNLYDSFSKDDIYFILENLFPTRKVS